MQKLIDENIGLHSKIRELENKIFELKRENKTELKQEGTTRENPYQADDNEESNKLLKSLHTQVSDSEQEVFRLQCDKTAVEAENQCLRNEILDANHRKSSNDQLHSATQTDKNESTNSKLIASLKEEVQRLREQVAFLGETELKLKKLENSERQHQCNMHDVKEQCRIKV